LHRDGDLNRNTYRERYLLTALAAAQGAPVPRETLAGGGDQLAADRSVDVQINRLRRKIESDLANPRWLMTVRGQGYRLAIEP
jgi:two-component system phosphate regulon response regulator OmpR